MGRASLLALIFKNCATEIAKEELINEKPFAPVSTRLLVVTPYPFFDILHGSVK
jgi:hypothetical protein